MTRSAGRPATPPSYPFPVDGRFFVEFQAPSGYGSAERRRWVNGVRRSGLAQTAWKAADYFNEWLAEALDRGGKAVRIALRACKPVDWEQRLREVDERSPDAPHVMAAHRVHVLEIISWERQQPRPFMADLRMEVSIGLPSGEWLDKEGPSPNWAELLVERIAALAPQGQCIITRSEDRPALLVTMRRLEGEVSGLEVSWEEMDTSGPE